MEILLRKKSRFLDEFLEEPNDESLVEFIVFLNNKEFLIDFLQFIEYTIHEFRKKCENGKRNN